MRSEPSFSACRLVRVCVASILVLVGVSLAGAALVSPVRAVWWSRQLASPELKTRLGAIRRISSEREARAADALFRAVEQETDRAALEAAAIATMRVRDVRGVPVLQARADRDPDDQARARTIICAARLSNRDLRLADWLRAGLASDEPWRRIGSALGLVRLGLPEGGEAVVRLASTYSPEQLAFVLEEFDGIVRDIAETVGRRIEAWPSVDAGPEQNAVAWAEIGAFWTSTVTMPLLCDVLWRQEKLDDDWHEIGRLLHAREKVARWLD